MKRLMLIRHPATAAAGTFCGHSDPDLSTNGEAQLIALERRLDSERLDRLISSDLLRARRCAAALARKHRVSVEWQADLRELHFGAWEGLNWAQIERLFPEQARRWIEEFPTFTPPGAEPYACFAARVRGLATRLLAHTANTSLALVSHRGVLQFLLQAYGGISAAEADVMTSRYATVLFGVATPQGSVPLAIEDLWYPD
jgi:alpha-ribazole phosphatase